MLEEIPGLVVAEDMTAKFVADGYWASYNVPYFEQISVESGNAATCKIFSLRPEPETNTDYCWENSPRAQIFRERQANVSTLSDLRLLINYNDWQNDAISKGDPCKTIACRGDLQPDASKAYPSGSMDGKVSSVSRSKKMISFSLPPLIEVRYGPTIDQQPIFCWSNLNIDPPPGQPNCFDFAWTVMPPPPHRIL